MIRVEPITVSKLNGYIKDKISNDEFLNNIYIKGEISNYKHHYTGHLYFTLKDENSLIKCIMFKTYTANLKFVPRDGMKVVILGTVSVYERDGIYQIYCKGMEEDGIGDLYAKFEQLKLKLEEKGYFKIENKKKIPLFPKEIGVLTSQTGSVIRDIINVSTRRNPNVHIKLLPVPVQGEGAEIKIAESIKLMNNYNMVDVIILARGGGSIEDLWPFNEEIVANAIFNSKIPIISAIGHETDFTIADFVADLRAPTPSAAAELVVANINDIERNIKKLKNSLVISLQRKTELMRLEYEKIMTSNCYRNPFNNIQLNMEKVRLFNKQLEANILNVYKEKYNIFNNSLVKLDSYSPLKTLQRGYGIVSYRGNVLKSKNKLKIGDKIDIILKDGQVEAEVSKL